MRPSTLPLILLLFPVAAFGQTATNDSQTLQSLLAEVRQLRQDLRNANAAAQRAQILIYRLSAQETATAHVSQRLDDAKERLAQMDVERKRSTAQVKQYEDMRERIESPQERKQFDEVLSQLKGQIEASVLQEQELQSKQTELEEQLRTEQAKLGRLQDELDRLDRMLEDSSRGAKQQ